MGEQYQNIHKDIIDRCMLGDRYAQNKLYLLYSRAMYNTCYRITNNTQDAEDVLQESFVSAFRNLHSYKATASFGAWLKRIVVNKAINLIRKRRPELAEIDESLPMTEEAPESAPANYSIHRIKEAISQLPDGYRLVFSLYLLEGYDHQEISQILGISESTSKSQFNRAKKKLKTLLQKEVIYE